PGVGERFLRWRAAYLGPEALVRQTLALCCADAAAVAPDVVAAHVALARERQRMPWAHTAFLQAARSIILLLARRRHIEKMIGAIRAPTLLGSLCEGRGRRGHRHGARALPLHASGRERDGADLHGEVVALSRGAVWAVLDPAVPADVARRPGLAPDPASAFRARARDVPL